MAIARKGCVGCYDDPSECSNHYGMQIPVASEVTMNNK
jgi:hypothetical protein